jgi:S-(hydroxymethyl)glutathione dehydrogenase / alcohol dehydrogenase
MSTEARVVVLPPGASRLEIQPVLMPDPGPWEVVVEQKATGVCHSQLGHIANADPTRPLVLGHESFGVVAAKGAHVKHVDVGDEVFVTWIPRSTERPPQPTRIPLANGDWAVTRNVFTWGTHSLVDEQYVVKAPPGLPADLASIIGCAVMTGAGAVMNCAGVEAGRSVAVWGVGGVGLVAVAAARILGASPVIAVDIDDTKLELAKHMGADHLINASAVDPVDAIRSVTSGGGVEGVDYSLDCTGRSENLAKSLAAVRPGVPGGNTGGSAVLVGVIRGTLEVAGMELLNGQKHLSGCLGGACVPDRDFATFVDWFRSDQLDLDALVTDRYPLEQVNEAVDDLRNGRIVGRAVIQL